MRKDRPINPQVMKRDGKSCRQALAGKAKLGPDSAEPQRRLMPHKRKFGDLPYSKCIGWQPKVKGLEAHSPRLMQGTAEHGRAEPHRSSLVGLTTEDLPPRSVTFSNVSTVQKQVHVHDREALTSYARAKDLSSSCKLRVRWDRMPCCDAGSLSPAFTFSP